MSSINLFLFTLIQVSLGCFETVTTHQEAINVIEGLQTDGKETIVDNTKDLESSRNDPVEIIGDNRFVKGIRAVVLTIDGMESVEGILSAAKYLDLRGKYVPTHGGFWMSVVTHFDENCQIDYYDIHLENDDKAIAKAVPDYEKGYIAQIGEEYLGILYIDDVGAMHDDLVIDSTNLQPPCGTGQCQVPILPKDWSVYRNSAIFDKVTIQCGIQSCIAGRNECTQGCSKLSVCPRSSSANDMVEIQIKIDPGADGVTLHDGYAQMFPTTEFPRTSQRVGSGSLGTTIRILPSIVVPKLYFHGQEFNNIKITFLSKSLLGMTVLEHLSWQWDANTQTFSVF